MGQYEFAHYAKLKYHTQQQTTPNNIIVNLFHTTFNQKRLNTFIPDLSGPDWQVHESRSCNCGGYGVCYCDVTTGYSQCRCDKGFTMNNGVCIGKLAKMNTSMY